MFYNLVSPHRILILKVENVHFPFVLSFTVPGDRALSHLGWRFEAGKAHSDIKGKRQNFNKLKNQLARNQ